MLDKKKILIGIVLGVLFIGYYYLYKYTSFSVECLFHYITGYYCPGCGITRMLFALLNLKIYQAFRFNPLVFVLLCMYITYKFICILFKKNIIIPNIIYYIIIAVLIIYGVLRNIPMFSVLKPTNVQ